MLALYRRFGFRAGAGYRRLLAAENRRARGYRSRHDYSLEETGLTAEGIVAAYRDIFVRFGFDPHGYDPTGGGPDVPSSSNGGAAA